MKSLATLIKGTLVIAFAAVFVNAGYAQTQPKPATEAPRRPTMLCSNISISTTATISTTRRAG